MVFMMRFFYLSGGGSGGEGGGVGLPGSLQQGLQGRAGVVVRLPENTKDGVKFSILPGFFSRPVSFISFRLGEMDEN